MLKDGKVFVVCANWTTLKVDFNQGIADNLRDSHSTPDGTLLL